MAEIETSAQKYRRQCNVVQCSAHRIQLTYHHNAGTGCGSPDFRRRADRRGSRREL